MATGQTTNTRPSPAHKGSFFRSFARHPTTEEDVEKRAFDNGSEDIVDPHGRPDLSPDDKLNLFRHLTGIISDPSMAPPRTFLQVHGHEHKANVRPAANLGIYARVIHNEDSSKKNYKYSSLLINSCLGTQIVVAAALTAMGAAGASRGAVTVFGAINTVIAGILTFLKGSGLPMRYQYYHIEWKRIREFIEQRERDFSRPNCMLDVYAVVDTVEQMYSEIKHNLESSTPDRFAGKSMQIDASQINTHIKLPSGITLPKTDLMTEKFKQLERDSVIKAQGSDLAADINHNVKHAQDAYNDLQAQKAGYMGQAQAAYQNVQAQKAGFGEKMKELSSEFGHYAHIAKDAVKDVKAARESYMSDAQRSFDQMQEGAREMGRNITNARVDVPLNISVAAAKPSTTIKDDT